MKKISIILGALGVAILLFDRLARVQHWTLNLSKEMADQLIAKGQAVPLDILNGLPVIGFILLALAALVAVSTQKEKVFMWSGVTFLIIVIAYLFKIMHWPLSGVLLVLSFVGLIAIILPWLTWYLIKPDAHAKQEITEDKQPASEPPDNKDYLN